MLCWRDSHCEQHTLVGMLRRDLQSIQGYTDMLLHFFFFGKWHLTHREMDHKDQQSRLVLDELEIKNYLLLKVLIKGGVKKSGFFQSSILRGGK